MSHPFLSVYMQYFFRLLDIEKIGALTANSVRYLFRDVARRMAEFGFEPPRIDDVKVAINGCTSESCLVFILPLGNSALIMVSFQRPSTLDFSMCLT